MRIVQMKLIEAFMIKLIFVIKIEKQIKRDAYWK